MNESGDGRRSRRKVWRNVLICVALVWALVLAAVQVVLSPSVLTGLVNDIAADMIDGDVSFGRVSASVLKSFPNLNVTLYDFTMTYPSGRFGDGGAQKPRLMRMGCGDGADTLASFREFSASVNMLSLISGNVRIPSVTLHRPRIFIKSFSDSTSNLNIIRGVGEKADSSSSAGIPGMSVDRVILDGRPVIVYCSEADSLYSFLNLKEMKFSGRLSTVEERSRVSFVVDSLIVSGRRASEVLALGLDRLSVKEHRDHIDLQAKAKTFVATPSLGRLMVPIEISSHLSFPEDTVPAVSLAETSVDVGGLPLRIDAGLRYFGDSLYVSGNAAIDGCRVGDVLRRYGRLLGAKAGDIRTDAVLSADASFDGWYDFGGGRIPSVSAHVSLPDAKVSFRPFMIDGVLGMDVSGEATPEGHVSVRVGRFGFNGPAVRLNVSGTADDLLGGDPLFDVDASLTARLDTVGRRIGSGLKMGGSVDADVKGRIYLSQMDIYRFAEADLKGFVKSPGFGLSSEKDSIGFYADSVNVAFGVMENTWDKTVPEGSRMLAVAAYVDSTRFERYGAMSVTGRKWSLLASNSADVLDRADSGRVHPFAGKLDLGYFALRDSRAASFGVRNGKASFRISPDSSDAGNSVPVIAMKASNGAAFFRYPDARAFARDLDMDFTAKYTVYEKKRRFSRFMDSMAVAYPDVPRDSLFSVLRAKYASEYVIPDWMTEKDFRRMDPDFRLDESIAKYFREWDFSGGISAGRVSVMSPLFPLRTEVSDFSGYLTNDMVDVKSFSLRSGLSSVSAAGRLTGLRRSLLGNGTMKLRLDAEASRLNLNELLAAAAKGDEYRNSRSSEQASLASLDDESFNEAAVTDTLAGAVAAGGASRLIVVPANLEADISLKASDVTYSTVVLNSATSHIRMMHRCLQITNTAASSNVGSLSFEGFYSTPNKENLKTGFRLAMEDITADKVIELMPSVDSIMPALKTFRGNLDGEVAVTASLDTNMNIVMPTLNGVIRLGGENLEIEDNPAVTKVARLLKFKDDSGLHVDRMSVEGQIKDSELEVFPFILDIDRYTLGVSGIQNFDQTFRYHVSVIRSPMVLKFGVDLYGNFDDFRYRIGKAKYRNRNVPVFSVVVDDAVVNLSESIRDIFRKGVDEAVRESRVQEGIEKHKDEIGYTNAVDIQLDSLSEGERIQLEGE